MNLELSRVDLLNIQMKVLYTYLNSFIRETITCDSASSQFMGEACANRILSFATRVDRMVDLYHGRNRKGEWIQITEQKVGEVKARHQSLDPNAELPGNKRNLVPVKIDSPNNGSFSDELDPPNILTEVQNKFIYKCALILVMARNEVVLCQSARNRSGIEPFDAKRLRSRMDEIRQIIYFSLDLEGRKALKLQTVSRTNPQNQFLAKHSGFSLHAGVACGTHDKKKQERICRYISRPSLSEKRPSLNAHGQVVYQLKKAYDSGTTHSILEPMDFLSPLASLIPKPRVNLVRFHGVFAPHFKYRALVVPESPQEEHSDTLEVGKSRSMSCAQRLKRVFGIDIETGSDCGGENQSRRDY